MTDSAAFIGPGTMVGGRYELVRRIGRGAMGVVHEARRVDDASTVAVKLLRTDLLSEGKAAYRFAREARLGARIESQHVVRTLDAGFDEKLRVRWLCMEYLPLGHLQAFVDQRGPLPTRHVESVLQQVFSAVAAAHRAGIVHRDLKPENILVADAGGFEGGPAVKVSDFGVAKGFLDQSYSATEAGLGTPLWTAPEQGRDGYVPSPKSDVWALGLISYWLLCGRQYWRAADGRGSVVDVVVEMQRTHFEPPSARATEQGAHGRIPPGFDPWFARAVTGDIELRFADATEAWRELEGVFRTPKPATPPRTKPWRAAALGLLVLALLALGLSLLLRS